MKTVEIVNDKTVINVKDGCSARNKLHKEVNILNNKIFELQRNIDGFNSEKLNKLIIDNELQASGCCLLNSNKNKTNAITGKTMQTKTHAVNCINNGGKGVPESVNDLVILTASVLKDNIIYLLLDKLKVAGYDIGNFNELLDILNVAEIVTRKTTAQREIVAELKERGVI